MSDLGDATPASVTDYLTEPLSLQLFEYWCSKRAGRTVPQRQDIDPSEIGQLLSRIFLVDFEEPNIFRYRIAGTEIAETFGRVNLKGITLADILNEAGQRFVTNRWLPVIRESRVVCMKGQVYNSLNRFAFGERLLLPLSESVGGPVTSILGFTLARWNERFGEVERRHSDMVSFPASDLP